MPLGSTHLQLPTSISEHLDTKTRVMHVCQGMVELTLLIGWQCCTAPGPSCPHCHAPTFRVTLAVARTT